MRAPPQSQLTKSTAETLSVTVGWCPANRPVLREPPGGLASEPQNGLIHEVGLIIRVLLTKALAQGMK